MKCHGRTRGLTLIEVLIAVVLLAAVALIAVWLGVIGRMRERERLRSCMINLHFMASAMRQYLDHQGRRTQWPDADGSDFLIRLYVSGVADSGNFLCPGTDDLNDEGLSLRPGQGSGRVNATSYAGRNNARQGTYPGLFTTRNSSETTVAADDDDGTPNHPDERRVLFADGHSEPFARGNPELGGFGKGGLLDPLGN